MIPVNLTLLKGCAVVGVFWGAFRLTETALDNENFEQLFSWYNEEKIRPLISRSYPLEDAAKALRAITDREAIGKIVLTTGI
jgi:NADPH2:quinone reductase